MLISRLYLNLRTFQDEDNSKSQTTRAPATLQFASNRILGNIGAPLKSQDLDVSEEEVVDDSYDGEYQDQYGGSRAEVDVGGGPATGVPIMAQDSTTLVPVVRFQASTSSLRPELVDDESDGGTAYFIHRFSKEKRGM